MSKVHSPDHYTSGGIEAIDYIEAKLGAEGFRAYCLGNVLKYVSRWKDKDGQQDLEKALVYLKWAVEGTATKQTKEKELSTSLPHGPQLDTSPTVGPIQELKTTVLLRNGEILSVEFDEPLMNNLDVSSVDKNWLRWNHISMPLKGVLRADFFGNLALKLFLV